METAAFYSIIAVLIVSLMSVVSAVPLLWKKKVSDHTLLLLLSVSVGVLLATVFINFIPEVFEHGYAMKDALTILLGFLVIFLLEKLVHYHHNKKCENGDCGHGHAYHLAPVNLIGDGVHNFIDGLVIAGAFAVNTTIGVAATISIIFHEIPQEIADFGVLLYSGMTRKRALLFNFLSALTSVAGAILGIFLVAQESFTRFILPFAAGTFLYIAATNLLPQLHRHCKLKDSALHLGAIIFGIAIIVVITIYSPGHAH